MKDKTIYKVFLPDGKAVVFYFMGEKLIEKVLNTYGIVYAKSKDPKALSKIKYEDAL